MNTMTTGTFDAIWTVIVDLLRANEEASEAFVFDCLSTRMYSDVEVEAVVDYLIDSEIIRSTMIARDGKLVPALTLVTLDFAETCKAA